MASGHTSDDESRLSRRSISFNTTGNAPGRHANPLGNTTPTKEHLGDESRGSSHTAGSDGEPFGGSTERARSSRKSRNVAANPLAAGGPSRARWPAETRQHQRAQ